MSKPKMTHADARNNLRNAIRRAIDRSSAADNLCAFTEEWKDRDAIYVKLDEAESALAEAHKALGALDVEEDEE